VDVADIRVLFDYDRWATMRVLDAAAGVDDATWSMPDVIGERGLGGILVHALGATLWWRGQLHGTDPGPRPEDGPLPTVAALRTAWEAEWAIWDAWLARLDDATLAMREEGVSLGEALLHLANHGTQHRSEAAAILARANASPGDLDLIDFLSQPRT